MPRETTKSTATLLGEGLVGFNKSINARLLEFVKEWGGVATVLIAILYTFPFDAASRFISWREASILDARRTLSEISTLYGEEASVFEKMQDPQLKNFLANTYNIRIYNKLYENREAINKASKSLLSSELYSIASFYTLAGIPDEGLPYYKLALEKSTKDSERVTIFRELGSALYTRGPNQNVTAAREAYLSALRIAASISYLLPAYEFDVTELGTFEMMSGDWKCGQDLTGYGLSLLDLASAVDPNALNAANYFHKYVESLRRGPNQTANGCWDKIPTLLKDISGTLTENPMPPPPPVGSISMQKTPFVGISKSLPGLENPNLPKEENKNSQLQPK